MKTNEINPFVRYARKKEQGFSDHDFVASDHRIFYCLAGNVTFYINHISYELLSGDVLYWPAGSKYHIKKDSFYELTGCNFDFTQQASSLTTPIEPVQKNGALSSPLENVSIDDTHLFSNPFLLKNMFVLESKFLEIAEEYDTMQIYYAQRCSAILKDILISCVRFSETDYNSKSAKLAQQILLYLRTNYAENITNRDIGMHFKYHPNYLNSLVQLHTGKSMHRYLMEYRINKAINLLLSSELSITEIALLVGIPDMKHFSKAFKNITELSPSVYRSRR